MPYLQNLTYLNLAWNLNHCGDARIHCLASIKARVMAITCGVQQLDKGTSPPELFVARQCHTFDSEENFPKGSNSCMEQQSMNLHELQSIERDSGMTLPFPWHLCICLGNYCALPPQRTQSHTMSPGNGQRRHSS